MSAAYPKRVAVLCSGGADSAVLLAEIAGRAEEVTPIYLRFGLVWEPAEEAALRRFVSALASPSVADVRVFEMPIGPVYGRHWSTGGGDVPGHDSPDEAVELPGRNLLQVVQPAVWCHLNGVPALALGILKGNPFPDATDDFFDGLERTVNTAVGGGSVRLLRPYNGLSKIDVLRRGYAFPLGDTFSCIRPVGAAHCGACNKCAERRRAFSDADIPDPTYYASAPPTPPEPG